MIGLLQVFVLVVMGFLFKSHSAVLSTQTDIAPTNTPEVTATPTAAPKIINQPSAVIFHSPTPTMTVAVAAQPGDWQYPNADKVGENKWQSYDSAKQITDWYVAKIKSMGLPVTSFVKTNANDKILNSLAAAKDGWKIKITIAQESSAAVVTITIDNS